jgi:hypothetical protein
MAPLGTTEERGKRKKRGKNRHGKASITLVSAVLARPARGMAALLFLRRAMVGEPSYSPDVRGDSRGESFLGECGELMSPVLVKARPTLRAPHGQNETDKTHGEEGSMTETKKPVRIWVDG